MHGGEGRGGVARQAQKVNRHSQKRRWLWLARPGGMSQGIDST